MQTCGEIVEWVCTHGILWVLLSGFFSLCDDVDRFARTAPNGLHSSLWLRTISSSNREKTMKKAVRFVVVMVALMAFASATVAIAATEFYVAKDAQGKVSIVDKKPTDATSMVKGPFASKAEAEKAMKDTQTTQTATPPVGK